MNLRNHLNRILHERGLAEGELASVCGLDQGHLNRIKNGRVKPSLVTALRIGNALGIPVNRIFYLDAIDPKRRPSEARGHVRIESGVGPISEGGPSGRRGSLR